MDPSPPSPTRAAYLASIAPQQNGEFFAYSTGMATAPSPPPTRTSFDAAARRPRRTSAASSLAESLASFHASSSHTSAHRSVCSRAGGGAPSMTEVGGPRLRAGGPASDGFIVDIAGVGAWDCPWGELVGLLMNPASTGQLPDKHLGKRLAVYLQNIVKPQSGPPPPHPNPMQGPPGWVPHDQSMNDVATDFSRVSMHSYAAPPSRVPAPPSPTGQGPPPFQPQNPPTSAYSYIDGIHYEAVRPTTSSGRVAPSQPTRRRNTTASAGEYRTPLQLAFAASNSPPNSATQSQFLLPQPTTYLPSFVDSSASPPSLSSPYFDQPHPQPFSLNGYDPPNSFLSDPQSLPYPRQGYFDLSAQPTAYSHSSQPLQSPSTHPRHSHAQREQQRRLSQPYQRPSSIHSISSSASSTNDIGDFGPAGSGGGQQQQQQQQPAQPPVPRPLRALNSKQEDYVWNSTSTQLFRVTVGVPREGKGEVLTFPPGSYYKVIVDDLEVLPSDGKNNNAWLRGQLCVPECRFRFERKRPATIRAHFMQCKARASLTRDPIKRLCELQTAAQRRYKSQTVRDAPRPGSSTGWTDHSESSSISEADEGMESFAGYAHSSHSGFEFDPDTEHADESLLSHNDPARNDEQAYEDARSSFMEADSKPSEMALHAPIPGTSAPGESSGAMASGDWNHPWLAGYGLHDPTNGNLQSALPDQPSLAAGSFLSMDEE